MKSVEQIEHHVAGLKHERVAWLSERPKVPLPDDPGAFLDALRAEWTYYERQRERLVKARDAIQLLIDECELSMKETEDAAALMNDIVEKTRQLTRLPEAANA